MISIDLLQNKRPRLILLLAVVPCKVMSMSCLIELKLVATADTMTSTANPPNRLTFLNLTAAD